MRCSSSAAASAGSARSASEHRGMASHDTAAATAPGDDKGRRSAWTRIASALVIAPPVIAATVLGSPFFELLAVACAVILGYEWWRMSARGASGWGALPLIVVLLAAVGTADLGEFRWMPMVCFGGAMMVVVVSMTFDLPVLWPALGSFYFGLPLSAFIWLRDDPQWGAPVVLWLLAVVWATDTAAYAAGRLIGGRKLAPRISPNKTWAGLYGGLVAGGLVGLAADLWLDTSSPGVLTALAVCLAAVAQAGDLLESHFKRHFRVKDTGTLIPGHGGLLDRMDGLLAAAAVLAVVLALKGGIGGWLVAN